MFKNIIFDLDGTLLDSDAGIINSLKYALKGMGLKPDAYGDLKQYIGPPLLDSFCDSMGLGPKRGAQALQKYREYYTKKGIFEAELYPGVPQMLEALHAAGRSIFLGTAKAVIYAERILEEYKIRQYFTFVGGSSMDADRRSKAQVLRQILDTNPGIAQSVIMVGDTAFDVEGALAVGIDTAAVLYGYGSLWQLEKAGAKYFFDSVPALEAWLLGS